MQIEGKLINHLPTQTGEGKNGQWEKGGFVIETPDPKYPKKIAFTTWGETVGTVSNIAIGSNVKVSFDVESREYQNKWYTEAKCFKVEVNRNGQFIEPQPTITPTQNPLVTFINNNASDNSDLPF